MALTKDGELRIVTVKLGRQAQESTTTSLTRGPALWNLNVPVDPVGTLSARSDLIQQVQVGFCISKELPGDARLLVQGPHFNK